MGAVNMGETTAQDRCEAAGVVPGKTLGVGTAGRIIAYSIDGRYHETWAPHDQPADEAAECDAALTYGHRGEVTVVGDTGDGWQPEPGSGSSLLAGRHQAETLAYAVGDDLVVDGVVYDRDEWQPDGEGGVEPRQQSPEDGRGWASPEAAAAARADLEQRASWHEQRATEDDLSYAADLRAQTAELAADVDEDGM
jgi:hypothetical protein